LARQDEFVQTVLYKYTKISIKILVEIRISANIQKVK